MIRFSCKWLRKDGTPIVTDEALQSYAEAVLGDYRPDLLEEPGRLDAFHFIESYLGLELDFTDIYYEEGESAIAGMMVFHDEEIRIFDRERLCIRGLSVMGGTILIDNVLNEKGRESYRQFTMLHECGHSLLHRTVFDKAPAACRLSSIVKIYEKKVLETENDFREHQANTFSAALSMPRTTFVPAAVGFIKRAGYEDGIFQEERYSFLETQMKLSFVTYSLAELYGVSQSAVLVQMNRQGLFKKKKRVTSSLSRYSDPVYMGGLYGM